MGDALEKDYDFGAKNHWRRTQWNFFAKHCRQNKVALRSAFGIYLCDADDIDRSIAINKGFSSENLIGINWDDGTCKNLRSGGFAVGGDLGWQILSWENPKIDFVSADFSGGLRNSQKRFIESLAQTRGLNTHCAVSINLLRGRDPESNHLRKALLANGHPEKHLIHRGMQAWCWYVISIINLAVDANEMRGIPLKEENKESCYKGIQQLAMALCRPVFGSYPSGHLRMDWVMFKAPNWANILLTRPSAITGSEADRKIKQSKRSRAAGMAHRTRKLN